MPQPSLAAVRRPVGYLACVLGAAACGVLGAAGCGDDARDETRRPVGGDRACVRSSEQEIEPASRERLGFAPDDVLGYAMGTHDGAIAWRALHDASHAANTDGATVSLSVARTDGPMREVHFEENAWEACAPLLELPVVLTVRSSDGALDERVHTTLSASHADAASLRHRFALTSLRGKLALRPLPEASRAIDAIELSAVITRSALTGAIWPRYVDRSGADDAVVAAEKLAQIGP